MRLRLVWLASLTLCFIFDSATGQDSLPIPGHLAKKYAANIQAKSSKISGQIDKQTEKYLAKLQKQEEKIRRRLSKIDSLAAKNIFSNSAQKYDQIRQQLENKSSKLLRANGEYTPWLDTATTSLRFLDVSNLTSKLPVDPAQLKDAMATVNVLRDQLKQAENIKDFIQQRKEYLRQQLKNYNLVKPLQKFNKQAYYYSQQINEYKNILNDPKKVEAKAISLIRNVPAFKKFMQQNGMLAGLFNIPQDYSNSITGLQTINQVQTIFRDRIQILGPNGMQVGQQNVSAAQASLSQLRKSSSGGNAADLQDFKPNTQKTKPFLKRLEFGTNLQSAKSNMLYPMTTDIGLSIGYKLNDKSVVGIGGSYKLGLGKNWNNVELSHQGISIRSFLDWKIKGSFYASGGFEYNFQQPFNDLQQLNSFSDWTRSGLIGLSKMISINNKFLKKTKVQFLWDFLSYQQMPQTSPFKFRVGYGFN